MIGRLLSFWASAYFQVTTIDGRNVPPGMSKNHVNTGVNCKLPFPQLGELDPEFWSINSTGWWFQIFFIFIPIPGEMIKFWRAYFSNGLVQPATRVCAFSGRKKFLFPTSIPPFFLRFAQRELFAMPDKQPHPTPAPYNAGPAANVVKKGPREERYERRRQAGSEVLWCFSGFFGKSEGYQFPHTCFLQEGHLYNILRLWNLTFMEIASLSNNYS